MKKYYYATDFKILTCLCILSVNLNSLKGKF